MLELKEQQSIKTMQLTIAVIESGEKGVRMGECKYGRISKV